MKTRTLHLNVTFGMTVVAAEEVFQDIAEQTYKCPTCHNIEEVQ